MSTYKQIDVQGIGNFKVVTTSRISVKITLGWKVVYEFEVWIMPHHAGVDLTLETDFMLSAGVHLDLFNLTVKLTDGVIVQLLKLAREVDE